MPTFRKRSNGWRAEVSRQGVRDSRTFDTKAQASAWAVAREAEILAGIGKGPAVEKYTLDEAIGRYITEVSAKKLNGKWEITRLNAIRKERKPPLMSWLACRNTPMTELTAADMAAYRDLRSEFVSDATVIREMTLLRCVMERARTEWGWMDHRPMQDVRKPKKPPPRFRRVSEEETRRMLLALSFVEEEPVKSVTQRIAVAFLFAQETAMRIGEICAIRPEHIFLTERYILLPKTKNGDSRQVPLSRRAIELLALLPRHHDTTFNLKLASADTLWRKARNQARISDLHFHDSRHEAITQLAKKLSVLELARMVGHRDLKSLMIYYNATATELAAKLD
ncbi:site-specific integrase [Silvimonas sp.]|uniref:tyrosine-type recombinase/integrase n=1 Tax=Silvimonas sp. TaxID=2650811 RepID=UPI0028521DDB|nr:site-specific integrase [Silvimonas sp.]MDR3428986.1 site-specific integrase [Silvimonas sp.]